LEGRWLPSTFVVRTTDDAGPGSLRQAILDANATPGSNEIDFAIGDGGAQTIRPSTALPAVTNTVVIDGTTQPGFAGSPLIDLDGAAVTPGASGLVIRADNSTVKGLAITGFRIENEDDPDRSTPGLVIAGTGDVVQGNDLGLDPTGTRIVSNAVGLWIQSGTNTLVGGTDPGDGNVISGNWYGVYASGAKATVVQGNLVGTDPTGTASRGNVVGLSVSGMDNLIGGTTAAARNIISGNGVTGVGISGTSNRVQGNYIGTDVTGTRAVPNYYGAGVSGSSNVIGGTDPGAGNLISGNDGTGVVISVTGRVQGNFIGTDATGTQPLGNWIGVATEGSGLAGGLIGGTDPGAGNLISGNRVYGIILHGLGDTVQGNTIGTDLSGTQALGNGSHGVYLETAFRSQIGGTAAGAGNLISGNGGSGVYITAGGTDNFVQGNLIGTDASGTQPLGNAGDGFHALDNSGNNTIGGEDPGAGNTIAFNANDGVLIDRSTNYAILGNSIFANGHLGIELLRGGNHDQQAPVLTSATSDGSSTTVTGTLSSTPNSTFTLELFANSVNDPSGSGERFLGSVQVTTDADGNANFTATFAFAVDPGMFLTATATDSAQNTSRFSAGVEVSG
jgi:hypothetical protein